MELSDFMIKIQLDLAWKRHIVLSNSYEFKPVWKYAFYGPAKKNKQGAVIVSQTPFIQIVLIVITAWFTLMISISRRYQELFIPILITAANLVYTLFFYKPAYMRISAEGISYEGVTYRWDDFIGAYMSVTVGGKSQAGGLVLIRQSGEYVYIDLSSLRKINIIATAIRDFQPADWKKL